MVVHSFQFLSDSNHRRQWTDGVRAITVQGLCDYGVKLLNSAERGETLVVILEGKLVAELRPLGNPGLTSQALLDRWKGVPLIDGANLRADLGRVMEVDL